MKKKRNTFIVYFPVYANNNHRNKYLFTHFMLEYFNQNTRKHNKTVILTFRDFVFLPIFQSRVYFG